MARADAGKRGKGTDAMKSVRLAIAFVALAAGPGTAASQASVKAVTVEGTEFRVVLADGSALPREALKGVALTLGDGSGRQRRLRIDSVEPDPRDKDGEVILYGPSEQDPESGEWRNACLSDPDGPRLGSPLAGSFTANGHYEPAQGKLLITCTGGAEGKCVRFGYKPWGRAADGTSLLPYYQACVRLVRADYAGDRRGTTRNGQPIDIYDELGVQPPAYDLLYAFQAGFGPDGATCVRHIRVKGNATLASVEASAPRLAGRTGAACDEAAARAQGAILFVRSPP
jgi:ADYC domain-containing protein